jgi:hypothetical protein
VQPLEVGGGNGAGAVAYCAGGIDPRGSSRLTTAGQGKGITVARGPGPTADNLPHIDVSTDLSLTGNEKAPVTRPLSISALLGTETSPICWFLRWNTALACTSS